MSSHSNKKILFYGYFGHGNTGDEAILESQAKIIKELNPNIDLLVLTANKNRAIELNIKPFNSMNLIEIYDAINECDLVISGGGGLFQDITGPFTLWYYGLIIYLANISKKPVFIFGQGFGPVDQEEGKSYLRKFLPLCTKATFRDEESVKEFQVYAPNVPTFHTSDPAFSYTIGNPDRGLDLLKKIGVKDLNKKIVYLTLREIKNLEVVVSSGINKWYNSLSDKNVQIVIIPFQYEYDSDVSNQISKLLQIDNYVCDKTTPSDIMDLFAVKNCELIISTRLHGLILGSISKKCCLGISYDPKVERISKVLNAPYIKTEEINQDLFFNLLNNTWNNRIELCQKEYESALKEKEKVVDTAKMALELIQ